MGSKSIENLNKIRQKHVDKTLENPNHDASTQAVFADILAEFPPV